MRPAVGVPPGSFVTIAFGIRSASLLTCVDFPEPSIPSSVMNISQTVPQPHQIVFTHQFLENMIVREKPKSFAETRAAAQSRKLTGVGQTARIELVNAEEVSELRVLAIENRARLSNRVLPPRERIDIHVVIVARNRVCVGSDLQSAPFQPVRQLD